MKKLLKYCLMLFVIQRVSAKSYKFGGDDICDDVASDVLVIKDDPESCGKFIACVGQIAQHFKCFSDSVYSNGSVTCLSCDEVNGEDEFYEDDESGRYGSGSKTTKKRFTYKQTKKTTSNPKSYGRPTRPPYSQTTSETITTNIQDYTISIISEYY